eukprot:365048-Chlamydomonas_euryale.AAC.10
MVHSARAVPAKWQILFENASNYAVSSGSRNMQTYSLCQAAFIHKVPPSRIRTAPCLIKEQHLKLGRVAARLAAAAAPLTSCVRRCPRPRHRVVAARIQSRVTRLLLYAFAAAPPQPQHVRAVPSRNAIGPPQGGMP